MGSSTPLLDILSTHLPALISSNELSALSSKSRTTLETVLTFALGGECPPRLPDARQEWSRTQPAALKALQDVLGPTRSSGSTKRPRDSSQDANGDPNSKRTKTSDAPLTDEHDDDLPLFSFSSVSATSPVRKKVDITVHARSIRFLNSSTRALESSIPIAHIARAFLLPTRGKGKAHWTVVLLPADAPDKPKTATPSSSPQAIFGLDARCTTPFDVTSYVNASGTPVTVNKGKETAPYIRQLLSHIPVPLLEPSATVFRSACATPASGNGAAGVDAYLSAKSGTLWFLDTGILWGESKPCMFWAVEDLLPKDGVRLISATGRTCSVILSRKTPVSTGQGGGKDRDDDDDDDDEIEEEEVVETEFAMVDGREQDPITAWARNRKHLFGKRGANHHHPTTSDANKSPSRSLGHHGAGGGTVKGPAWDDSDPEDDDFEATSSEDLEHSSASSDAGSGSEDEDGGGQSGDEEEAEAEESGEEALEEEELQEAHHPLLRPGAMPRMSKAAINMVVDLVQGDLADDASDEEDELEE